MDRSGGIGRKGGHKWRYKGGKVDVGGGIRVTRWTQVEVKGKQREGYIERAIEG